MKMEGEKKQSDEERWSINYGLVFGIIIILFGIIIYSI